MSNSFEEKSLPNIYEEDMNPPDEGVDIFSTAGKEKLHAIENDDSEEPTTVNGGYPERAPLSDLDIRRVVVMGLLDSGIGETAEDVKASAKVLSDYILRGE